MDDFHGWLLTVMDSFHGWLSWMTLVLVKSLSRLKSSRKNENSIIWGWRVRIIIEFSSFVWRGEVANTWLFYIEYLIYQDQFDLVLFLIVSSLSLSIDVFPNTALKSTYNSDIMEIWLRSPNTMTSNSHQNKNITNYFFISESPFPWFDCWWIYQLSTFYF